MKRIKAIWEYLRPKSRLEIEEQYLAESTDLVDLENRIRKLDRGYIPRHQTLGW